MTADLRACWTRSLLLGVGLVFPLLFLAAGRAAEPLPVGGRLELFVDDYLIERLEGDVRQQLIQPEPQEVVFETGEPWEGNTSGYFSFFRAGDTYRMIYRGWRHDAEMKAAHEEVTCYAESSDGVHWTKPKLGLFEWEGSKQNNIVWKGTGCHNFTAFLDTNPAAPREARYKALGGIGGYGGGLVAFRSPDCIHWTQVSEEPMITHGAFDSQNLAFWDPDRSEYRAYWRHNDGGVRGIRTATSSDFRQWENEADLTYEEGTPQEHLYTNAIQKYFRAPHLFLGFPTRFDPKSQQVEPILMSSRDGVHFQRYAEPVIPRTAPQDRNHNRSNYMAWGMFPLPGQADRIAVYATENYYESTPGRVRLFTYRTDGFVAMRGGPAGGTVTTKPLAVEGTAVEGTVLRLNYQVQEKGRLVVEGLDADGTVISRSQPLHGDAVDAVVPWTQPLEPQDGGLRLRFVLQNADLYAFQFSEPEQK